MIKKVFIRCVSVSLFLALLVYCGGPHVLALEPVSAPSGFISSNNSVTFSALDGIDIGERVDVDIVDSDGNPATVSIERVCDSSASRDSTKAAETSTSWKVSYTGVVINCYFYMTVSENRVTNVYDNWILIVGGTYTDSMLSKTSSYGKLSFKVEAYAGIMAATCWLKGTVTGSDNEIVVSYEM